ncbi:MAG: PhzF family phenazine biosynthesis isomerase [Deltaproteobacteria bacterium]|jgi:PhzF family phenazine biosynthesis protein|nr:PhzF family phenazine biosynthesis isomerase [Deltaproteobacteria bacterium]
MANVVHTIVFSYQEGGGNPCPVVLDADRFSTEEMQAMTRKFMHESAFVCSPTRPECDYTLRYFVPLHEMEMCVHATIGTTTVLVKKGIVGKCPLHYETKLGVVRVEWEKRGEEIDVAVEQFLPTFMGEIQDTGKVCASLRIRADELADYPVQSVATSRQKLMVPLKRRETLDNLDPDFECLWNVCDEYETTGFYPFAPGKDDKGNPVFFSRQFPKRAGYPEDPATGVAASGLGAYLAHTGGYLPVKDGWNSYTILQGFAMGKPSVITSEVLLEGKQFIRTRIKGNAYLV